MTKEEFFDLIEKDLGARFLNGNRDGSIRFEMRVHQFLLPVPANGACYTSDEIDHIIAVWNNEHEGEIMLTFNNKHLKEV